MNGGVATRDVITPDFFEVVYAVPNGNPTNRYVLYRRDLLDMEIKAYAEGRIDVGDAIMRDPYTMRITMFGTRLWRVCPSCSNQNPDGFTCCTWCGAQFIFREGGESSKRKGRDRDELGTAEAALNQFAVKAAKKGGSAAKDVC